MQIKESQTRCLSSLPVLVPVCLYVFLCLTRRANCSCCPLRRLLLLLLLLLLLCREDRILDASCQCLQHKHTRAHPSRGRTRARAYARGKSSAFGVARPDAFVATRTPHIHTIPPSARSGLPARSKPPTQSVAATTLASAVADAGPSLQLRSRRFNGDARARA